MPVDAAVLEAALGHRFEDRNLLLRALTHRSHASERRSLGDEARDNEQLEFLGDAVLGFIVSEWLVERYPDFPEGRLSVLRASLVSAVRLHETAQALELGHFLQLGRGEEKGGGRLKNRLLANAVEALIAALYLDGGMGAARSFVLAHVAGAFDADVVAVEGHINYKGPLQERAQELGLPQPRYAIVDSSGPDHAKCFTVEVRIGEQMVGRGEGSSKKVAGQNAARALLNKLDCLAGSAGE